MTRKAILLISHGSRSREARFEVNELSRAILKKMKCDILVCAFLEINKPDIMQGIEICEKTKATEITVLLNFLNSGRHVKTDIPKILKLAKKKFPRLSFVLTPPLGRHSKIPALFCEQINHRLKNK